jgi:hypothetical protein
LRGSEDDDRFKEEKQIDRVLMVVLFLLGGFVGYVLVRLL